MIKKSYEFFSLISIFLLLGTVILSIILSRPELLEYIGDKYIKSKGIEYSDIRGTLFSKIILKNVKYKNVFSAKKLSISYNISMLLLKNPNISKVVVKDAEIKPENYHPAKNLVIPFSISKLEFDRLKVYLKGTELDVVVKASNLTYSKDMDINNLKLFISSKDYGKAEISGTLSSNTLKGKAKLYPDKKYLKSLKEYPYPFVCNLTATAKDIKLDSKIKRVKLNSFTLEDIDLTLNYLFNSSNIEFNSMYQIKKDNYLLQANQKGNITTKGDFASTIDSKIIRFDRKLPFNDIFTTLRGDSKNITLHVEAGKYKFDVKGDYKKYDIKGVAKGVTLRFLNNFPDIFKNDRIDMRTTARLDIFPLKLSGGFFAQSVAGKLSAKYKIDAKSRLFKTIFYPNAQYKIWKDYRVNKISPAKITIYNDKDSRVLNIDAKMLNVTLFRKKTTLAGWGNLATGYFNLNGSIDKKSGVSLSINANLSSLRKFLEDVGVGGFNKNFYVDAKVNLKSKLNIKKDILFKSKIAMPWYRVVLDNKTRYEGKDLWIKSTLKNTQALISGYSFYILNHHIYSNRASRISFKKSGEVEFKEFWVFDNLLLKGVISLLKKEGKLHLKGKKFRYKGKEGDITADANITATLDSSGKQSIKGTITLLGGVLNVEPKKGYDISDEDIIIIQNIRQNRASKRTVDVHIESKKPINYKIKDVRLRFVPDFTIFQEEGGALEFLGMVTIKNGEIRKSGKKFELLKSEVYLRGANPMNPYLNLNFLYLAQNDVKIKVFIANTLASPLIILASNPPMNQNDIMSYILFGKPAGSALENSKNSQTAISLGTLLYGTGLKKMFQDTTHINIDTLNILSSKDKRFGYEVGASLNDKVRVVYKNDTISSIIIQYSLSKSIRIDVDVKESGEGVRVLYAKDF
ncbi:MAG: translocation/assembly module TamB domain-containing protein [Sulfurospirillum sp.]